MAEGEPALLSTLDVGHPQVVAVDEGDEVRVPGADLGVHAGPGAVGLHLHRLDWRGLLESTQHTHIQSQRTAWIHLQVMNNPLYFSHVKVIG